MNDEESNNLGRALYERFMRTEYRADWRDLPDGIRNRWIDAAQTVVLALTDHRNLIKAYERRGEVIIALADKASAFQAKTTRLARIVSCGPVLGNFDAAAVELAQIVLAEFETNTAEVAG